MKNTGLLLVLLSIMACEDKEAGILEAAKIGDLARVQTYIEKGVNVNSQDEDGLTAWTWASRKGHLEVAEYLIAKGAKKFDPKLDKELLLMIQQNDDLEKVKELIEKGADIHAIDKNGDSVLMQASLEGKLEVVKILVENGADLNYQNKNGLTVLMQASYLEQFEIIKYLVENGADVNLQAQYDYTALGIASELKYTEVVEYLESKGAK